MGKKLPMSINIYLKQTVSVVLCAIFCLSGCAGIPKYPSQLPPLVQAETNTEVCPDISGRYADKGISISPEGKELGEVSLTEIIHQEKYLWNPKKRTNADRVVVIGPKADTFAIQSWQGGMQVDSWSVTGGNYFSFQANMEGNFFCEWGFVRFPREYTFDGDIISFGNKSDFLRFRKAVDGSLIVWHKAGEWGLLFIRSPIWHTKHNEWYRFPPVGQRVQRQS